MLSFLIQHIKTKFMPVICAVCLAFTGGCALLKKHPEAQMPKDVPGAWAADTPVEKLPVTASLLDLIKDERLKELVQEALDNNPDIQATALRLKAAGFLLSEPRSKLLPKVNAGFSKGRSNQTTDDQTGDRITEDSHRLGLGVSWEIDIWGRLADQYAASKNAFFAQEYEYLRARDALAARVIQAWVEQTANRRAVTIEEKRVEVLDRIENVLLERYRVGLGNLDELSTAKSRTEIARADLSARRAALLRSIRKLEVLLGRYPKGELLTGNSLPQVVPPPVSVPAAALLNRPDIQTALARVESARNISSSAKKAILPELRLSGQLFKESANLSDLGASTTYWSVLGLLLQPLFEGGRIINESRARSSEAEASLMNLHETVLQALKEVEDAFGLEKDLARQAQALEIAVLESEKSSRYFAERYRQGLDSIQNLLIAKEQEVAVRNRLNAAEAERLTNRVDLALALGVGLNDKLPIPAGD